MDAPAHRDSAKGQARRAFAFHGARCRPDIWFKTVYTDASKFGTKPGQYVGLEKMLQLFPDVTWIAAHMGGDPEHPDHLEALLERYPNLYFDTSATKWQVREVSPRAQAIRNLVARQSTRFLFGSDLVTRTGLTREHYVSRYWCQRTLWESTWQGQPIADPTFPTDGIDPAASGRRRRRCCRRCMCRMQRVVGQANPSSPAAIRLLELNKLGSLPP